MEAKTFGAFALGFSSGSLCLCVVLWSTGALRSASGLRVQAAQPPGAPRPAPALPNPAIERQPPATGLIAPPPLVMPVQGVDVKRLTDTFKDLRDGRQHEALDIAAARGTPVMAAVEGNVVKLFHSKEGGTTVYQFDDSRNYCYYYAHLDRYAPGLKEGTLLRQGEVLGYVGATGNARADAPHLHFAVFRLGPEKQWWKGVALDPLPMFGRE
jgi:murein DD-endopeptidase MepM/ murein hydrolase activator NlpD